MFLHLGSDAMVPIAEVIAILDIRNKKSAIYRHYMVEKKMNKPIVDLAEGDPSSYVLTNKTVYLSNISSLTLKKRAEEETYQDAVYSLSRATGGY